MKIVQINTVATSGSTGRIVSQLYTMIESKNGECYIAYGRGIPAEGYKTIKVGNKVSIAWHGLCTRLFDLHGRCSHTATKKLIKELERIQPDLIHLHSLHGYYINYALLFDYFKRVNMPVVWTLHDCWAMTGHCPHFYYAGCRKWETLCHDCQLKWHHPSSYFLDLSTSNYKKKKAALTGVQNLLIVTPSNWLRDVVKQSYLREYSALSIHNGLDVDLFSPGISHFRERYGITAKKIILGVASVWSETKGLTFFLEMQKRINPNEIQIVIVGVTHKQKNEIDKGIIAILKTDSVQELIEIYRAADLFVNPTLEDNFPTTNLEALACGTPVVTFDTGGSPEALNDRCGIVCKEKTVDSLLEACYQALNERSFGEEDCRKRALEFSSATVYEKYWQCYQGMLAKSSASENG